MYGSVRGVPGDRHSYRDKLKCRMANEMSENQVSY